MATINAVTLEVPDTTAAEAFYEALGVSSLVKVRSADGPSTGFRGYTLSVVVAQPNIVDAFVAAALTAGATTIKPVTKSFWGYGGVVQAPDGAIWKVASSAKKDTGPASLEFEDLVLLLGVADVKATKQFYVDRGLAVEKSYGSKYVQFASSPGTVTLGLYKRAALAKDAGVLAEGSGSHRITVSSDAGSFTDADGFVWDSSGLNGA
ncbi:MAG: glyoxalase [Marmoricola sp.]|nr:glyoxalase [Marmoricola sp.]